MRPIDVVQRQLNAFNKRDIDDFLRWFAPDAFVLTETGDVLLNGRDEMRSEYTELFRNSPDLSVEVLNRMVSGPWVIDEDIVTFGSFRLGFVFAHRISADQIRQVVQLSTSPEGQLAWPSFEQLRERHVDQGPAAAVLQLRKDND